MGSVLEEIVELAKQNIDKTDFFINKGYGERSIYSYQLGYLENGLYPFADKFDEDIEILKCYQYVIPDFDKNNRPNYLILRSEIKTMHKLLKFEIDKHYIIGDYKKSIWNAKVLDNKLPLFICETWTDALSVIDCGYDAIALNRITNITSLWKKIKKNSYGKKYVLFCDNDYYGKKSNDNLTRMLESEKCQITVIDEFPSGIKDANEWFLSDRNSFNDVLRRKYNELC